MDADRMAPDTGHWRTGFPPVLFDRLKGHRIGLPGQRLLELAGDSGFLARAMAARGALVTAVDASEEAIEAAEALDRSDDIYIDRRVGPAEATALPGASFDAVVSGPAWKRLDRTAAAREAYRLLAPGGRLALVQLDWLPLPGSMAAASEELARAYLPDWPGAGGTGLHPDWLIELDTAGLTDVETFSFDCTVGYRHDGWRRHFRDACVAPGRRGAGDVERFDMALRLMLAREFPQEPQAVRHRAWVVLGSKAG